MLKILDVILVSLKFIDRYSQDRIRLEILELNQDYAEELSKPYDQIDDARLHSIRMRLDGIADLYRAAAQRSDLADLDRQAGPDLPLSGAV